MRIVINKPRAAFGSLWLLWHNVVQTLPGPGETPGPKSARVEAETVPKVQRLSVWRRLSLERARSMRRSSASISRPRKAWRQA